MNFSYSNYVKRFKYNPYEWPPDISLAELHSRCSQSGPVIEDGVKCPCCDMQSKHKIKQWIKREIYEDFQQYGSAVPAYFWLLKYYAIIIFIIICINSVMPIIATYHVCQNYNPLGKLCLKVGFIYYLDFNTMIKVLQKNNQNELVDTLLMLQTIVFYLLLIANTGSIFYLAYLQKKEKKAKTTNSFHTKKALLIHNVSEDDHERLIKHFQTIKQKLKIVRVIKLKEIKKYLQAFNLRNQRYYRLLSYLVVSQDPYLDHKNNKLLVQANLKYWEEKPKYQKYCHRMIVIFETQQMAQLVHNMYRLPEWKKWFHGSKVIMKQLGILSQLNRLPLLSIRLPKIQQIKWENAGQSLKQKLAIKLKSFFIAGILIGICYIILYFPIKFSLQIHTSESVQKDANLSTFQKVLPLITSLVLVTISIYYRFYMVKIANKRNPLNQQEKSKFVMITSLMFHFLFYLLIPTIFFTFDNGINQTVKLYVISQQARSFIFIQLILSIIDMPYRTWKRKKIASLSDQRQGFRYCQNLLHKVVQYRDYPLQLRLNIMFRIWSFALFYAYFLPYMMVYMFIALVLIYVLDKRNLYKHYTLRRKISLNLQLRFLVVFVNFFIVYQCLIYCFNAINNWMIYSAVGSTLFSISLNIIYSYYLKPKQQNAQNLSQKLLKDQNWTGQEYQLAYDNFLSKLKNEELQHDIEAYLNKYQRSSVQSNGATIFTKLIQMSSESQANDDD